MYVSFKVPFYTSCNLCCLLAPIHVLYALYAVYRLVASYRRVTRGTGLDMDFTAVVSNSSQDDGCHINCNMETRLVSMLSLIAISYSYTNLERRV